MSRDDAAAEKIRPRAASPSRGRPTRSAQFRGATHTATNHDMRLDYDLAKACALLAVSASPHSSDLKMSALGQKRTCAAHKLMSATCLKRTCSPTPHDILRRWRRKPNRRILAPMAHLRVTCLCGAIYEVIENESPLKDRWPSKCVLCDRELFPPDKAIGQVRLVWRPDEDRE